MSVSIWSPNFSFNVVRSAPRVCTTPFLTSSSCKTGHHLHSLFSLHPWFPEAVNEGCVGDIIPCFSRYEHDRKNWKFGKRCFFQGKDEFSNCQWAILGFQSLNDTLVYKLRVRCSIWWQENQFKSFKFLNMRVSNTIVDDKSAIFFLDTESFLYRCHVPSFHIALQTFNFYARHGIGNVKTSRKEKNR